MQQILQIHCSRSGFSLTELARRDGHFCAQLSELYLAMVQAEVYPSDGGQVLVVAVGVRLLQLPSMSRCPAQYSTLATARGVFLKDTS
jgi:hypothetical protein